jgi:hypothetical protein
MKGEEMVEKPQQFLFREVEIHPYEADRVADKIAEFILNYSASKNKIESIIKELSINWEFHKNGAFQIKANLQGDEFTEIIKMFHKQENYLRDIIVMRKERYLNPEYEKYISKE